MVRRLSCLTLLVMLAGTALPASAADPIREIQGDWPGTCGCWLWRSPHAEDARTIFLSFEEKNDSGDFVQRAVLGFASGDAKLDLESEPDNLWVELPTIIRYQNLELGVTLSLTEVPPTQEELERMEESNDEGDCSGAVKGDLDVKQGEEHFVVAVEGYCGC